jgi:hypothetical protein
VIDHREACRLRQARKRANSKLNRTIRVLSQDVPVPELTADRL